MTIEDLNLVTAHEIDARIRIFRDKEFSFDGAVTEFFNRLEVTRFFG